MAARAGLTGTPLVEHDGRKRLLSLPRHLDLEQRAAVGAAELAQLELGMQGEIGTESLRRPKAPPGLWFPILRRRSEIDAAQAAEVFTRVDRRADLGEASRRWRLRLRRLSA